jgi:small-conductance mechanosensitive channel
MERHTLRALLSVGVLVIVTWLGIALFAHMHAAGRGTGLVVIWAVVALVVLGFALWNLLQARRARVERSSEDPRGR